MAEITEFLAKTRQDWRSWLAENHETAKNCWLITYKKSSGKATFTYAESVEEALCFGWIDSVGGLVDAEKSKLYFSPRKPKSAWAGTNKARVERLISEGKMTKKGLEMVELAKKTGTWTHLDDVEKGILPDDLIAELARFANAGTYFAAFQKSVIRMILDWIKQAKTPETRKKRIEETARLADENVRANQWVKKK
jgi:uncharacterized protein YdeI (YjbR/CyaY-like superfamily)